MIFLEFDLAGAEWVVTAYLSGDKNMIGVVESGKSPHIVTGSLISSVPEELVLAEHKLVGNATDQDIITDLRTQLPKLDELLAAEAIWLPRSMSIRQAGKKSNHGLNYGMRYRRAALEWEVPENEAEPIVHAYSSIAYPGLQDYWAGIRKELRASRTLVNCFGRKVHLLGEWGHDLFQEAYSFIPQSTVVDICNKAMCMAYEDESELFARMELGAEVHDSLLTLYPLPSTANGLDYLDLAKFCLRMREYMRMEIEYNGRKFRIECDLKAGLDWGAMTEIKLKGLSESDLADIIRSVVVAASEAQRSQLQEAPEALGVAV